MVRKSLFLAIFCLLGGAVIYGREPLKYAQPLLTQNKPFTTMTAKPLVTADPTKNVARTPFSPQIDQKLLVAAKQKLEDAKDPSLTGQISRDTQALREITEKEVQKAAQEMRTKLREEIAYTMRTVLPGLVKDAVKASINGIGSGIGYVGSSVKNFFTSPFSKAQETAPKVVEEQLFNDDMAQAG